MDNQETTNLLNQILSTVASSQATVIINIFTYPYSSSISRNCMRGQDSPSVNPTSNVGSLFCLSNGDADQQRAEEEKNRFLNFLRDHHWSKLQLDCSRNSPVNKAIVCFCLKWRKLKFIRTTISPMRVVRFFVQVCGLQCAAEEKAIAAHLGRMLKSPHDKEMYFDVEEYFS